MNQISWPMRPLSRCAKFLSGGTPSKSRSEFWAGDIPWVSSGEMTERRIYDTSLHVTEEGATAGSRLVPENTVLAVVRGMSLAKEFRVSLTMREVTFNQDIKALVSEPDVESQFLYYALLARRDHIRDLATEASHGTKRLETDVLSAVEIPVPRRDIQRRIVHVIAAYDELIENNRRRMALLEASAQQLYREWFVRLRFPDHEHIRITNGVPEGWERVPTPDAVDINPPTRLSDEVEHWSVEMADLPLNSMVIQQATWREGRSGSKFKNGDTLFARITPCLENGKTAFVDFLDEDEVARGSTEFIVLRSKRLTPEFVYCLARTYAFREDAIKSMIGSSGRQRVQESCFDKFLVLIAPRTLLDVFTDAARPMFRQVKTLHSQNQKLRAARDLLLPRLMSGEIAV